MQNIIIVFLSFVITSCASGLVKHSGLSLDNPKQSMFYSESIGGFPMGYHSPIEIAINDDISFTISVENATASYLVSMMLILPLPIIPGFIFPQNLPSGYSCNKDENTTIALNFLVEQNTHSTDSYHLNPKEIFITLGSIIVPLKTDHISYHSTQYSDGDFWMPDNIRSQLQYDYKEKKYYFSQGGRIAGSESASESWIDNNSKFDKHFKRIQIEYEKRAVKEEEIEFIKKIGAYAITDRLKSFSNATFQDTLDAWKYKNHLKYIIRNESKYILTFDINCKELENGATLSISGLYKNNNKIIVPDTMIKFQTGYEYIYTPING